MTESRMPKSIQHLELGLEIDVSASLINFNSPKS